MSVSMLLLPRGSIVRRREIPIILTIALCWTLADFFLFTIRMAADNVSAKYIDPAFDTWKAILVREINVLLVSLVIGFLLISVLRRFLQSSSLWFNLVMKTLILAAASMLMNFFIHVSYEMVIRHHTLNRGIENFLENTFRPEWILPKMAEWIVLFLLTQLALEINEKYSRGLFLQIMAGKYLQPKQEHRIILFIDLRNSTPIAEKLGHKEYFKFIRDFIFCISAGIMECGGHIYQYVGDEIVAWWPASKRNAKRAIQSLIASRKVLNKNNEVFKRKYDILPEYKAGMHTGIVTVGQVGIAKKELVMSGDTINTAARIRSACTDLSQKFLVSKEIVDLLQLPEWQSQSMGMIDLKGKNEQIELFALKI